MPRFEEEIEHEFMCPHCWQTISMLVDTSITRQSYIEDCEICCNPIEIEYEVDREGFLMYFDTTRLDT